MRAQVSSHGESVSTLAFGSRVSEVTLGQAKKNSESGRVFEAREALARLEREAGHARSEAAQMREEMELARQAAQDERDAMEQELAQLKVSCLQWLEVGSSMHALLAPAECLSVLLGQLTLDEWSGMKQVLAMLENVSRLLTRPSRFACMVRLDMSALTYGKRSTRLALHLQAWLWPA